MDRQRTLDDLINPWPQHTLMTVASNEELMMATRRTKAAAKTPVQKAAKNTANKSSKAKAARTLEQAVFETCLAFPEAEEKPSRGTPNFWVRGKTFANYVVNHHGDGLVALWLYSPPGAQQLYVGGEPEHYFVPPYVGPKGWLGVHLNTGLGWGDVVERVREAYERVAPKTLAQSIGVTPKVAPPEVLPTPEEIDPYLRPRAQEVLAELRGFCAGLPEVEESRQFGSPSFKAGKKTFITLEYSREKLRDGELSLALSVWVGPDLQASLTADPRFRIPSYTGVNGWILMGIDDAKFENDSVWQQAEELMMTSYRHFALKRMLKAIGEA